jgi:hypothetical protein
LGEIDVSPVNASSTERKQAWALRIWRQTRPGDHTLAETYLRLRGIRIELPDSLH